MKYYVKLWLEFKCDNKNTSGIIMFAVVGLFAYVPLIAYL